MADGPPDPIAARSTVAAPAEGIETQRLRAALRSRLGFDEVDTPAPRLDRFVVLQRIGQGGMGTVFSAFDPQLDRRVALKLIRRDRAQANAAERLLTEARMLAKVEHPNVVRIYDCGECGDEVYLAMELVAGQSLHRWARGHMEGSGQAAPWREAVGHYAQAAAGLAAAHEVGVVHRDFKPSNAMLGNDGVVRVLDFGLAWSQPDPPPSSIEGGDDSTRPQRWVEGTPGFMAPEQASGAAVDHRADQFSLCVSLYLAITGQRPPLAPKQRPPVIPRWLFEVLRRGLAPDPADRFETMAALEPSARSTAATVSICASRPVEATTTSA